MIIKIKRYNLKHYLLGALPARLGDEMSGQAILLVGIAASGSAAIGSALLAALTFSAAVGGPFLGAVLDRSRKPGSVLAIALALYALGICFITLSLKFAPIWMSITIALAAGLLMPAISGGWSSRIKSFISDDGLTRASAIDATTFNLAGLVGPALAGLVAVWLGAGWAIAVLATMLVAAVPMAWALPRHQRTHIHTTSFLHDVMAGFRVIITNKSLLRITLTSTVSYMGIGMVWVICPAIGQEVFGNAGYGGVLMSILSIGALAATAAYAKWPTQHSPDTITFITTFILSAAMLLLALAGNTYVLLMSVLIAGIADGPQLAAVFAVRHRESPVRSRSQVFTTGASLKITAAAVGAVLAGQLVSKSLRFTVLVTVAIQLLAAMLFVVFSRKIKKSVGLQQKDKRSII